jgi:predicted amidophosphoribosyltransferase
MPGRSVEDFTDPYLSSFTRVPPVREGVVCRICHGATGPGYSQCASCWGTLNQVSREAELVIPAALYERYGPLHNVLRNYKDGPEEDREQLRARVAALLGRFLGMHQECIHRAGGSTYDAITIIPSSRTEGRPGPHPMEQVLALVPWVGDFVPMLRRGAATISHNRADDHGYEPLPEADGTAVLLVDDTFTTGARLQSAASALSRGGANVVAAVVVGRFTKPNFNDETQALWNESRSRDYSFDYCCLCDPNW